MNRLCICASGLLLVAGASGCDNQAVIGVGLAMFEFYCTNTAATATLPELPPELLAVQADPERFSSEMDPEGDITADHPLLDMPVGTVIDDLSALDGCWGRYYRVLETAEDRESSGASQSDNYAVGVLEINVAEGRIAEHRLRTRSPMSAPPPDWMPTLLRPDNLGEHFRPWVEGWPEFTAISGDLVIESDHTILQGMANYQQTALDDAGQPTFDCTLAPPPFVPSMESLPEGYSLRWLVTLQGNYLKTRPCWDDPAECMAEAAEFVDYGHLWFRLDCSPD